MKYKKFHLIIRLLYCEGGQTPEQIARQIFEPTTRGDTQSPVGSVPEQSALPDVLWAGGWTSGSLEVTSHPNYPVFLWSTKEGHSEELH